MLPIIRLSVVAALLVTGSAHAKSVSKADDCKYQGQVVAAIQTARLERVKEGDLAEHIASTNPEWPERYNNAIGVLGGPIYDLKRRDIKTVDLGMQWNDTCLAQ
jgi:hypothetical protein